MFLFVFALINLYYRCSATICRSVEGDLVLTNYGCIRGSINKYGRSFTSIPYAKPPIPENNLRFQNPVEPNPWNDDYILDTTSIAPACMQTQECEPRDITCYKSIGAKMSEDCLYLNIYTPNINDDSSSSSSSSDDNDDLLPVMFYIHGGNYDSFWSGSTLFNGQTMAYENNVIVVTINYRLGSFGYYYNPDEGFDGNYGYFDQLQALRFVYENIEYFGGDKTKIVLYGESAGAMSVGTILMNESDDITEMYSGAIMQSNPFGLPFRTSNSWESVPDKYIKSAQCNDNKNIGKCLRTEKTSQELLDAQLDISSNIFANCKTYFNIPSKCYWIHLFLFWTPTFKTNILPQLQPLIAFENGEYNKNIPIIIGTNKDEGITFVYQLINQIHGDYTKGLCKTQYKALIYSIMGFDLGNQIIDEYKNLEPNCFRADYRPLLSKIISDFWFVCSSLNVVNSISKNSKSMVYKYNYNYLYNKWDDTYFLDDIYCQGKNNNICHGVELPIVFHDKTLNFNDDENALSQIMQMYWTNLALLRKPGPGKIGDDVEWVNYDKKEKLSMIFTNNANVEMVSDYEIKNGFEKCLWWDKFGYPQLYWTDRPFRNEGDNGLELPDKIFCNNECDDNNN